VGGAAVILETTNLVVEFVVSEYIERWWPADGLAGIVFFRGDDGPEQIGGDITFFKNKFGEVLINIEETLKPGVVLCRTFIDNVERIVIL
jgi:hypothetical protein